MTNDVKLTPRQIKAIGELLSGKGVIETAQAVGVSRQTMTRWLADPKFKQALADGEAALMSEINRRLLAIGGEAVDYLKSVLAAPDKQAVGVRASNVVLGRLLAIRELTELEQRITALEQTLQDRGDNEKS